MKKHLRIDFIHFWQGFDKEDNLYTNILKKLYDVKIVQENPDFVFYSVYKEGGPKNLASIGKMIRILSPSLYYHSRRLFAKTYNLLAKRKKVLEVPKNVVKIFCGNEYMKPNMQDCDYAFGAYFEEEIGHKNYMRIPPYLTIENQLEHWGKPAYKRKINFAKIKKEKVKFCNFLYSQDIPLRNNFFTLLNNYKHVDSPGRCMNNMEPLGKSKTALQSRLSKNWPAEKLEFLKQYKFTIAFENFPASGWVTEKLTNPMLVDSIPIYIGHKDVAREFNTKSFINYNDYKNFDEFIEYIKKVDNDPHLWLEYLKQPFYTKEQYSKSFNEKKLLKRFKEIFG